MSELRLTLVGCIRRVTCFIVATRDWHHQHRTHWVVYMKMHSFQMSNKIFPMRSMCVSCGWASRNHKKRP